METFKQSERKDPAYDTKEFMSDFSKKKWIWKDNGITSNKKEIHASS